MSDALKKKVFFITDRWLDSNVQTSEARVSVVATSSNDDTESGTRVSSTGRRMGGGLCSCCFERLIEWRDLLLGCLNVGLYDCLIA